jgi:hypothetical protein
MLGTLIALIGGAIAIQSLRLNARTNKSKFILDLTESFIKDKEIAEFWYRLDYKDSESWKFDLSQFRHSAEEHYLNTLLYRCSVTGQLLRMRALKHADLVNLFIIIRQIFSNKEVRDYLRFNVLDFHRSHADLHWPDAIYLYTELLKWNTRGKNGDPDDLKEHLEFVAELKRIPYDSKLREAIARRIKYDGPIS